MRSPTFAPTVLRRTAWVAGLSGWLFWSVFLPETIPLYGLHLSNVKLSAEIGSLEREIHRLEREKIRFKGFLTTLEQDPLYWEATARDAGMTRDRERAIHIHRRH